MEVDIGKQWKAMKGRRCKVSVRNGVRNEEKEWRKTGKEEEGQRVGTDYKKLQTNHLMT